MRKLKNKAFTLVELLVVITILAVLSVVAYESFGGVTDKAHNATKTSNFTAIANKIGLFKTAENYYPMPQSKSATNRWGYDSTIEAQQSNTMRVEYNEAEIKSLTGALTEYKGGGIVYGTGAEWKKGGSDEHQVGARGVIGIQGQFNKKYLDQPIYDNQLGDIELTGEAKKMIDYGIGKFVYAVYARASAPANWNITGTIGSSFELATTLKIVDGEGYITKKVGTYSSDLFSGPDATKYPATLLGLEDKQKDSNKVTTVKDQGIPYPIDGFAK